MIRCVIFDLDNTLYDFSTANAAGLAAAAAYAERELGMTGDFFLSKSRAEMKRIADRCGSSPVIHSRMVRYSSILTRMGIPPVPHAIRLTEVYWGGLMRDIVPLEGIEDFLKAIKGRGIRTGVGTNMLSYMQFLKLDKLGIGKYFDFVVTSEEAMAEKPDRAFFDYLVSVAGFPADECLFIGDDPVFDEGGAFDAGMEARLYGGDEGIRYPECVRDGMPCIEGIEFA